MFISKSKRVLVAAALAATLCAAVPAQAADWSGESAGFLDRLAAWVVDIWAPAEPEGGLGRIYAPEAGFIDPNGGGPRPGSCDTDPGCNAPKGAVAAGRP